MCFLHGIAWVSFLGHVSTTVCLVLGIDMLVCIGIEDLDVLLDIACSLVLVVVVGKYGGSRLVE